MKSLTITFKTKNAKYFFGRYVALPLFFIVLSSQMGCSSKVNTNSSSLTINGKLLSSVPSSSFQYIDRNRGLVGYRLSRNNWGYGFIKKKSKGAIKQLMSHGCKMASRRIGQVQLKRVNTNPFYFSSEDLYQAHVLNLCYSEGKLLAKQKDRNKITKIASIINRMRPNAKREQKPITLTRAQLTNKIVMLENQLKELQSRLSNLVGSPGEPTIVMPKNGL